MVNENSQLNAHWEGHHSSLHYNDIEDAGQAVRPLDFPKPEVHRAAIISSFARNHTTSSGHSIVCDKLLVRIPDHQAYSFESHVNRAYLIKKRLSKSTYGCIRLCVVLRRRCQEDVTEDGIEWESTDELVALKASLWSRIRKQRGRHMEDPIKEVAALQHSGNYHPNVLGCLEVLQDDENLYTIMPYCKGGDLYSNIMAGQVLKGLDKPIVGKIQRPDEDQARVWFRQLSQGLFHLQKKGICHRDLSLENILLDEYGQLVIVDLGLALRVPYADASNQGGVSDVSEGSQRLLMKAQGQCGELLYIAPELLEKEDAFDGFAVDLWSAGVILFVSLVGLAPFRWAHHSDVRYSQIANGRLRELLRDLGLPLSDEAADLLQNMLWRDPRKRLTLAQVMNHPWVAQQSRKTMGLSVIPESNQKPPVSPSQRRSYVPNVDTASFQKALIPAACQPSRAERLASF
jgi:serine/threonine protein kinase